MRPYGVGLLVIGYDSAPHLFETCPSGNFFEFKGQAIGSRSQSSRTYIERNVDALPALFQTTLSPSLTVAEFLSQVQSRYQERKPGQLAFHLSLARMPCGNVQHRVSIPLCKYEVPVMQLLGPEDHLMLCAVAPQE